MVWRRYLAELAQLFFKASVDGAEGS